MTHSILFAVLAVVLSPAMCAPRPTLMNLVSFDPSRYAAAVCNDGSRAGFYIELSSTGSSEWVIALDGGFWCWDLASCVSRARTQPNLTSSKAWPRQRGLGGLFSSDPAVNPRFASANKVLVGYCSSDMFWGRGAGLGGKWQFQGRAIMDATFDMLLSDYNMMSASLVVLSGCSAGGQAAVTQAERSRAILTNKYGFSGHFKVVADAGWMMDMEPMAGVKNTPIRDTFRLGAQLWNATSSTNTPCMGALTDRPWDCFFTGTALEYTTGPVMVQASVSDEFQVPWNTGKFPPYAGDQLQWINSVFTPAMRFEMFKGSATVFAPNCYSHCLTFSDSDFTKVLVRLNDVGSAAPPSTINFQSALTAFINNSPANHISQCQGFNCSYACPLPGQ